MNRYCTFYIVRHGQTDWNVEKRIQGSLGSNLTEIGISQAKSTALLLKEIHIDAIFASPASRAQQTAKLLLLERKLEVLTAELLRERSFGPYEGKFISELKEHDEIIEKLSDAAKFTFKFHPQMESDEDVASRFITFLRETAVGYPGKTIALVTHSGTMRSLLIHLGFGTYKQLPYGCIANSSYIALESDGVDFFIKETKGITKHE